MYIREDGKEKGMNQFYPKWVAGTMSGTSLDGVEAATLLTDGNKIYDFGEKRYQAYSVVEREILHKALGKWPGDDLAEAEEIVQTAHIGILDKIANAELAGFHGQTLAHDPKGLGTHQLGNGKALADLVGLPVVWDFRANDLKNGGEGAPLAPFFHFACAKWMGANKPLAFLNLGGVGNITWIDPEREQPDDEGALLAFDTGPANAPINDLLKARANRDYDHNGDLASAGNVNRKAVAKFSADPYFELPPPKSLDRDHFSYLPSLVSDLETADAAATLTAICCHAVLRGIGHCPSLPSRILVAGGGRNNAFLMSMLSSMMDVPVIRIDDVNLDGDYLEAQAFAFLAARSIRGMTISCPGTTGVKKAVTGGILSTPDS